MKQISNLMVATLVLISSFANAAQKKVGDVVLANLLQGEQKEVDVVLKDTKTDYVVSGEYIVPIGKTLTIEKGVTLLFDKSAEMLVQGALTVNGNTNAPVVFKGKATGIGFWRGVAIEKSDSSDISGAIITGATIGMTFKGGKPALRKSIVYNNAKGVQCMGSSAIIEDCAIVNNRGDGCSCDGSGTLIEHCLISRNLGWGVYGHYCASPTLLQTIVTNNKKGGIYCNYNKSKVTAHGCSIYDNKTFDVLHGDNMEWDFSENWWGDAMTKFLQAKGCNVRLPKIKDRRHGDAWMGMVNISDFLKTCPKDCGPRECVHVKGVY